MNSATHFNRILVLMAGLACLSLPACEREKTQATSPARPASIVSIPSLLVTPDWLSHQSKSVIIVDARNEADYAAGHIEGSVHLPVDALIKPSSDKSRNIAPIDHVESVLGAAGIDSQTPVVVYDAGTDYRAAARLFMVLELHGHPSVAVLDGGLPGWTATGRSLSTAPVRRAATRFVAHYNPQRLATKVSVIRATRNDDVIIVDSRSPEEYRGEKVNDAPRAGHIPRAINIDARSTVKTDSEDSSVCRLATVEQLRDLYRDLPNKPIITYCSTGNRASVNYLALRLLGRQVAVYDGSWREWASDFSLPIETHASVSIQP